ncbi:MAG: VanZ family protein, partial [Kiritimatiellaceae bacterium]|nr:VanZ family protein [Kiritimatiellaceae bacterium]
NIFVVRDPVFNWLDCAANVWAFVPLATLLWLSLPRRLRRRGLWPIFVFPLLVGMLTTGSFEVSQRWMFGRVPSLLDVIYNLFGTLLGCGLLWLGLKHRLFSVMMQQR